MTLSTIQTSLMPITFALLLLLVIVSWAQVALFADLAPSKKSNRLLFQSSILLLTGLLVLRWIESGHFPLSNLYESLLFLAWSCLIVQLVLQYKQKPFNTNSKQDTNRVRMYTQATPPASGLTHDLYSIKNKSFHLPDRTEAQVLAWPNQTESLILAGPTTKARPMSEIQTIQKCSETVITERPGHLSVLPKTGVSMLRTNNLHDVFVFELILSPLALVTFGFAFLSLPKEMQKATALVPALQSNWLMMHVTVMIVSYAALLCGSVLSIAFLVLKFDQVSKHVELLLKRFDRTLTPIDTTVLQDETSYNATSNETSYKTSVAVLMDRLDNYSYRILTFAFPLLTCGILSGAVWANEAWGSYWSWDPKETWALITWLVFAIYLHTRITKGWSGEKPAIVASFGFFVVWFCYLGVNLLGEGLHSYGWFSSSNIK